MVQKDAGGGDDADAGVGGELGLNLVPVAADVVPGLVAGFRVAGGGWR